MMRRVSHWVISGIVFLGSIAAFSHAAMWFEKAPIYYHKADADNVVTRLQEKINRGDSFFHQNQLKDFVKDFLAALDVPVESQVLVFSKTSLQTRLISAATPRALYFSDNAYAGYMPGGKMEIAVHDPKMGMAFYVVERSIKKGEKMMIERDDSCLTCHATRRTQGVPGVFVRSVKVADKDRVENPSFDVTHETPYRERWGGWYVTGDWGNNFHRGNTKLKPRLAEDAEFLEHLSFLSESFYPRDTSDVVALAVLEHQCYMHNVLIEAKMLYERGVYYQQKMHEYEGGDLDAKKMKLMDGIVEKVLGVMLFKGEARIASPGLEGDPAFIKAFQKNAKKDDQGKSLKDFRLFGRIFKYRCSYMVYSDAFTCLPTPLKMHLLKRVRKVMQAEEVEEEYQYLKRKERRVIDRILSQTLPEYSAL